MGKGRRWEPLSGYEVTLGRVWGLGFGGIGFLTGLWVATGGKGLVMSSKYEQELGSLCLDFGFAVRTRL